MLITFYNSFIFMRQFFNIYLVYRFYLWYLSYFNLFLYTAYNFIFKKEDIKMIEDKKRYDDDFIIIE